ncbi:FAD dependent oxidoreductase [Pseudomonas mandelii JR-1]|uniref:FAD dependent oxidoreductase n=1 Tax=Pseudomonas mandelii JR-1 TaxID=1147786 RepID=A0A024E4B2_9PSED|nr:FAD dependent oxidoreductase [Pseudomonas mandelii JR-1]
MLRGLLKHTSLMKLFFYNFMKNYSINFMQATQVCGDLCHG